MVSEMPVGGNFEKLTLDLLEPLLVESANLNMLLLENLQASHQGVRDGQVIIILMITATFRVVKRSLHLADNSNNPLCLVDHLLLLRSDESDLAVEGFG